MEILLKKHEVISLDGNLRGTIITCTDGGIWLTQEGDPNDHILQPGVHFTLGRKGKIVLCGLSTASLELWTSSTEVGVKVTAGTKSIQ